MSGWGGKYPVTERSTECPTDALSQLSAFRCRSSQKVWHLPPPGKQPHGYLPPRTNAPNFSKHGANAYTFVQGGRCPGGLMSVHRPATPCERGFPAAQIPLIGLTSFVSADLTVQPWQETCSTVRSSHRPQPRCVDAVPNFIVPPPAARRHISNTAAYIRITVNFRTQHTVYTTVASLLQHSALRKHVKTVAHTRLPSVGSRS